MPIPTIPSPLPDLEINNTIKAELDTRVDAAVDPTWSDMGACFKNIAPSLNEILFQASYYGDGGWGRTEVTGGQWISTFTGEVMPGDTVSDYLTDPARRYGFGTKRKTYIRLSRGNEQIIWAVTLAKITMGMGDATAPNSLIVEIHSNGQPSIGTVT
ncbi:MAG: hypothetical protein QM270_07075 [Bacillota bacterium]|nr:hypothetical protein [Bacillota bacterium]